MPVDTGARNEVFLTGRLAAPTTERELPSGDVIVQWRVVVERPDSRGPARGATVDTLECIARRAGVRRASTAWAAGDVIAVEGALRRRFWRSAGGPTSRYEVEIVRARRVSKAA